MLDEIKWENIPRFKNINLEPSVRNLDDYFSKEEEKMITSGNFQI